MTIFGFSLVAILIGAAPQWDQIQLADNNLLILAAESRGTAWDLLIEPPQNIVRRGMMGNVVECSSISYRYDQIEMDFRRLRLRADPLSDVDFILIEQCESRKSHLGRKILSNFLLSVSPTKFCKLDFWIVNDRGRSSCILNINIYFSMEHPVSEPKRIDDRYDSSHPRSLQGNNLFLARSPEFVGRLYEEVGQYDKASIENSDAYSRHHNRVLVPRYFLLIVIGAYLFGGVCMWAICCCGKYSSIQNCSENDDAHNSVPLGRQESSK